MFDTFERGRIGAALLAVMVAAGCGGGEGGGGGAGGSGTGGAAIQNPVDPATAGSISGRVLFTGTPAAGTPIDMADEPQCASKHTTPPVRGADKVMDGGLDEVFVYVTSGPVTSMQFPTPGPVTLDQDGCIYMPHVIGVMAGQQLTITNSDPLMHNVNATPTNNRPFNRSQPNEQVVIEHTFTAPEVMIPVRCDVHGWMEAYIGVTSHPYNAVTANGGNFTLENLPPGDYQLEAWHERYGTQTATVTVPPSGRGEVTITFNSEMAGRTVPMAEPLVADFSTGTLRPAQSNAPHAHSGRQ